MAALCHDVGHLPFSHAAEELLPDGETHEAFTVRLIQSEELQSIWKSMTPPLRSDDIVKLAVGKRKLSKLRYAGDKEFSDWEAILSELIVGDAFGVDRIDYLIRDSLHAGVAYGHFDHYRLIDTLRILPPAGVGGDDESNEPHLGVEDGGLNSAEALLLARYFMFTQVYLHPVRLIYDIHLKDYLTSVLPNGTYPEDLEEYLMTNDNRLLANIADASKNADAPGHESARRIDKRQHFKLLWRSTPVEANIKDALISRISDQFSESQCRHDTLAQSGTIIDFPVWQYDDQVVSAASLSTVLKILPSVTIEHIFVDPAIRDQSIQILNDIKSTINQRPRKRQRRSVRAGS